MISRNGIIYQVNKGETMFWKVKEEEHQESNMGQLNRAERQKDNARQSMEQSTTPTQLLGAGGS